MLRFIKLRALFLVVVILWNASSCLGDVTITYFKPSAISAMQTWRQVESALERHSIEGPSDARPTRHTQDLLRALKHQRPYAVSVAGSARAYASGLLSTQAETLKGFSYEQSILRRWNSKRGPYRYVLAQRNHEFADILEVDRATDQTRRALQIYSGGSPRTALEKLFLSDAEADKLVLPRDCFDKIDDTLDRVLKKGQGILSRMQAGVLDQQTGLRSIRKAFAIIGINFDSETMSASFRGRNLGRVDHPDFLAQFANKLVRDRNSTSSEILHHQISAQVETSGRLAPFRSMVGGDARGTALLMAAYNERRRALVAAGLTESAASRKAAAWLHNEFSTVVPEQLEAARVRARLLGMTEGEIASVSASALQESKDAMDFTNRYIADLDRQTRFTRQKTLIRAQAMVLTLAILGATTEFTLSGQDFQDWLQDRRNEWGLRIGTGSTAVAAAAAIEKRLLTAEAATEQRSGLRLIARKTLVPGTAAALFLAGETLIAVAFRDATYAEVRDIAVETALVLAVSEGAVLGTEWLVSAAGFGSWGGPIGAAAAVGATMIYEGAKYAYNLNYQLEGDHLVFMTRCDVARSRVKRWCDESCRHATIPNQQR